MKNVHYSFMFLNKKMEEVDDWSNRQTSVAKTEDTVSVITHVSLERELKPPVFLVLPSDF